ncbi:MAG: twin-arginine translocation signal domain-containing protein [Halorientalis sp.]
MSHRGNAEGGDSERTINRRDVLKGTATGAVALTGVTAFSGSASAGSCLGLNGTDVPDGFPMIEDGSTSGNFPSGTDELLIFVHGWMEELSGDAIGQAYTCKLALDKVGYNGDVVGYKYPSNNPWWWEAKDTAEEYGRQFAHWLHDYMDEHPGTTVRLVCHSLGAHTSLACLDELQQHGASVTSLSLTGAAVDSDSVTEGWWSNGKFYDAVENGADEVDNYHSGDDGVLEYIYTIGEFGDEALGDEGADGSAPGNYQDHDVTASVADHCEYFQPDTGCMDRVLDQF